MLIKVSFVHNVSRTSAHNPRSHFQALLLCLRGNADILLLQDFFIYFFLSFFLSSGFFFHFLDGISVRYFSVGYHAIA